ncbi:DUF1523 family protein [Szabonella alba]|uniref:DUF1523 family protein n=1 Tax=Szabonella alba TaxID=2804194 RepID=A0A8K0VEQ2_9RHOB|nr:DUF1523 family protein [Szabonella alba]MBL4918314.1 DUF1523 family protein [Szabonella alba]
MRYVKWTLLTVIATLVLSFFHYTLPQVDIVRIVGTETRRIDFGENSFFWSPPEVGSSSGQNYDVFFIQTFRANDRPMVYRNQDTGWGWPPYFKINSFNLQAQATNLISTNATPQWVAVRHYGWRNEFFTIFPNAVSVWPVEGPDARVFPWINIVILTTVAGFLVLFWRMWAQFRERTIDPTMDRIGDRIDAVEDRAGAARGRFGRWIDSWRDKSGR